VGGGPQHFPAHAADHATGRGRRAQGRAGLRGPHASGPPSSRASACLAVRCAVLVALAAPLPCRCAASVTRHAGTHRTWRPCTLCAGCGRARGSGVGRVCLSLVLLRASLAWGAAGWRGAVLMYCVCVSGMYSGACTGRVSSSRCPASWRMLPSSRCALPVALPVALLCRLLRACDSSSQCACAPHVRACAMPQHAPGVGRWRGALALLRSVPA
jgi:hypothetical protein